MEGGFLVSRGIGRKRGDRLRAAEERNGGKTRGMNRVRTGLSSCHADIGGVREIERERERVVWNFLAGW